MLHTIGCESAKNVFENVFVVENGFKAIKPVSRVSYLQRFVTSVNELFTALEVMSA